MSSVTRRHIVAGAGATVLAGIEVGPGSLRAQGGWPAGQTIRMVVPFAPGGATDVIGRLVAERMAVRLGTPVVVENLGGAGANIGMSRVAHGPADGSVLLFTSPAVATNAFLYPSLDYDPERDLVPVSLSAVAPALLLARKTLGPQTLAETIAFAKANPGKLTWGHNGAGTATHMTGELFQRMAGVEMTGVAYRSGALAMNDVVAGNIDLLFDNISSALPQVEAGTVRCLGITSAGRHPPTPTLPPIAETVPGFEAVAWFGVMARAGTPAPILERLEADAAAAGRDATVGERLAKIATQPVGSSAAEFGRLIEAERSRWGKLIKDLAIRAE